MKTNKPVNFKNIEPDMQEFLTDAAFFIGKYSIQKLAKLSGMNRETLRTKAKQTKNL